MNRQLTAAEAAGEQDLSNWQSLRHLMPSSSQGHATDPSNTITRMLSLSQKIDTKRFMVQSST